MESWEVQCGMLKILEGGLECETLRRSVEVLGKCSYSIILNLSWYLIYLRRTRINLRSFRAPEGDNISMGGEFRHQRW